MLGLHLLTTKVSSHKVCYTSPHIATSEMLSKKSINHSFLGVSKIFVALSLSKNQINQVLLEHKCENQILEYPQNLKHPS